MKKFAIAALFIPIFLLACKNEGCRDVNALNFDPEADKDGTCRYTKVIFHAPGEMIGGVGDKVVKIEIFRGPTPGEELIGTITEMNQPAFSGCTAPEGAIEYELTNGDISAIFITRYYFDNDTDESGETYVISASNTKECIVEGLTL